MRTDTSHGFANGDLQIKPFLPAAHPGKGWGEKKQREAFLKKYLQLEAARRSWKQDEFDVDEYWHHWKKGNKVAVYALAKKIWIKTNTLNNPSKVAFCGDLLVHNICYDTLEDPWLANREHMSQYVCSVFRCWMCNPQVSLNGPQSWLNGRSFLDFGPLFICLSPNSCF